MINNILTWIGSNPVKTGIFLTLFVAATFFLSAFGIVLARSAALADRAFDVARRKMEGTIPRRN